MKSSFATSWKSSVKPRKQRKYVYNAPLHTRGKMLSAHLDATLRKKHGTRSMPVRKGDTVKVVRGQHKGKSGKIDRVDRQYGKIFINGIAHTRKDGTKSLIAIQPSNVLLTAVEADKKRL